MKHGTWKTNLSRKKRTEKKKKAKTGRATKSPYSGKDSCSQLMEAADSSKPIWDFLEKKRRNLGEQTTQVDPGHSCLIIAVLLSSYDWIRWVAYIKITITGFSVMHTSIHHNFRNATVLWINEITLSRWLLLRGKNCPLTQGPCVHTFPACCMWQWMNIEFYA